MADTEPTLAQGLSEHMRASGETLEVLNRKVFLAAELQGGLGYLHQLTKGDGNDPLYGSQTSEGSKALAKYLIENRPRLKLHVFPLQPARQTMETSGGPSRGITVRKPVVLRRDRSV